MVLVLAVLLIGAAFALGVFIGYSARAETTSRPTPRRLDPTSSFTPPPATSTGDLSDAVRKLAEEFKK